MVDVDAKREFSFALEKLTASLDSYVSTPDGQWAIKGFIDVYRNVYSISSDTKVISKLLEIHLLPRLMALGEEMGYELVLAEKQNYYPDVSYVNETVKFAVDFKSTFRLPQAPDFCNGFTLGSHGNYFVNRTSDKNVQFPYNEYDGHFCLGVIYNRDTPSSVSETNAYSIDEIESIPSVISNFQFFAREKWTIASDKRGSGNTANIGSITNIPDIISGNGMFRRLGEAWFDDYWMNYGQIVVLDDSNEPRRITNLEDFVIYRGGNVNLINPRVTRRRRTRRRRAQ